MWLTAMGNHDTLKDITETSCIVISTIWAIEVDSIIVLVARIAVKVGLEFRWQRVFPNDYPIFEITVIKFISEYIIGMLREFRLELVGISYCGVKTGYSIQDDNFLDIRIVQDYVPCSCNHIFRGNCRLLEEEREMRSGCGDRVQICDVCRRALQDSVRIIPFGRSCHRHRSEITVGFKGI